MKESQPEWRRWSTRTRPFTRREDAAVTQPNVSKSSVRRGANPCSGVKGYISPHSVFIGAFLNSFRRLPSATRRCTACLCSRNSRNELALLQTRRTRFSSLYSYGLCLSWLLAQSILTGALSNWRTSRFSGSPTEVASLYHTGMRRLVASKAADPIATISVDQGRTLFGGCAESNQ